VYVGLQTGSAAALASGSNREVTFSGQPTVTVPAGAEVLSDPVDTTVPADTTIAVSVHVVGASGALTGHNFTAQTSYASAAGDFAADESGTPFAQTVSRWYWVDAVVVEAPKQAIRSRSSVTRSPTASARRPTPTVATRTTSPTAWPPGRRSTGSGS
jgi:hypothetical protein